MTALGNKDIMAKNLRYYIEKSGKERRELAELWEIPYSTLSDWMNARRYPRIDRIEVMANYFHIQKSDLIEDKQEKPGENGGLSDYHEELIAFAKTLSENQASMMLKIMKTIVASEK